MSVLNAVSAVAGKAYKLVSKISGVPKNMPEGAVSLTETIIEHTSSGNRKTIQNFLNKDGKSVQIRINDSSLKDSFIGNYEWERFFLPNGKLHSVEVNSKLYGKKNNVNFVTYQHLDTSIGDDFSLIITSTSRDFCDGLKSLKENITRLIKREGKTPREISKKVTSINEGSSSKKLVETSGKNIPADDAEQITSYPYFDTMFFDKEKLCRESISIASKRQGVNPMKIQFKTVADTDKSGGWCSSSTNTVAITNKGLKGSKTYLIGALEHETRHKWQHDLVDKMQRSELTHPEEIELAKKFKKEFDNYIDINKDYDAYYKQLVEVDAREAGTKAEKLYTKISKLVDKYFDGASGWSFLS